MNIQLLVIIAIGALLPMINAVSASTPAITPAQSPQTDQTEYFYYSSVEGKVPLNLTVDKLGLRFRKEVPETDRQDFFNTYSEITPVQPEVSLKDVDCTLVQINDSTDKDCLKSVMDELAIQPELEFVFPVFHKGENGKDFMLTDRVSVVADNSFNKKDMEALFTSYGLFIQDIREYKRICKTAFRLVSSEQPSVKILQAANSIDTYAKGIHAVPVFKSLFPTIALIPNDPLYNDIYGNGWHLYNMNISPPYGPDHINAEAGWDIETGNMNIVVAILDTGIDFDHVDLDGHIWTNTGEIPDNLIDDDGNGYLDDVHGWNFCGEGEGNNVPSDDNTNENGHGTKVSGVVSAETDTSLPENEGEGQGVAGTVWNCTLMPIKVRDATGSGTEYQQIDGILYALDNGAHIINMSGGGSTDVPEQEVAVSEARAAGILLVAATGNDDEENVFYPAAYPSVMAVGGSNFCGERWRKRLNGCNAYWIWNGSNFGNQVDVIAPAIDITSTILGGGYSMGRGTSFSAPQVSGLASLILSATLNQYGQSTLSPIQTQAYISLSAFDCTYSDFWETAGSGRDKYSGYGRIDVYQSLMMSKETKFSLHDTGGPGLFSFDQKGNLIIDGVIYENVNTDALALYRTLANMNGYEYVHVKDSAGISLMHIDNHIRMSGFVENLYGRDLRLRGKLYRIDSNTAVIPPDGSIIIKKSSGQILGFLNSISYNCAVPYIDLQGNSIPMSSNINAGSLAILGRTFIGGDPDRLSSHGSGL